MRPIGAANLLITVFAAAAVILAGGLAVPRIALAAFPGENGKIAFVSGRDGNQEIYSMNSDGSGQTRLTSNSSLDSSPRWSADGQKIAFMSLRDGNLEIYSMRADGSEQTRLTNEPGMDRHPTWSPDGQMIAFDSNRATATADVWVMDADGSSVTNLTPGGGIEQSQTPSWSPDGQEIAFSRAEDIMVMDANGGSARSVLNSPGGVASPDWSPGGDKIAYTDVGPGGNDVYVVNADGSGETNLTNSPGNVYGPAWSPDGQRIAFNSFLTSLDIRVMNADGSAQTRLPVPDNDAAPNWQPIPDPAPIVFVHGFAGSKIACGGDQLYPDVPIEFDEMRLEADGITNRQTGTCNPLARPTAIVESFLTEDVYGPALEFLDEIAPDNNYVYVWDWRKAPGRALDELDLLVEEARCGGELPGGAITCADPVHEQVVLMGHSMGGLVIRDYINDQPRADKVVRALTLGTPYWGSPKAIFPLATGLESPAAEGLDSIIVDSEFQEFARNAQGLFHLYPSANFGGWLTVEGRQPGPLDRTGLLSYVSDLGGTPALLARALDDHAQSLDGFRRNGVNYQAFVGAGLPTVERVLFFEAGGEDYVKLNYAQGDGTVPVRSAAQGPQGTADPLGENIPIHYSCGIGHVPLPGDPAVTSRIEDFLVEGAPVMAGPTGCSSSGLQIEIFELEAPPGGTAPAEADSSDLTLSAAKAADSPMTLEQAELAGMIQLIDLGAQKVIVTDSATPLELSYPGDQYELNVTPLNDAVLGQTSYYGPLAGDATISVGPTFAVADAGGVALPRTDGAPAVSITDASAAEGAEATLEVTLSRSAGFPTTIDFRTEDASAIAGSDYSSRSGTLVFDPGQLSEQVTVPISSDGAAEADESFRVRLSNPTDLAIADGEAVATIAGSGGGGVGADTTVDGAGLKATKLGGRKIGVRLEAGADEDVQVIADGQIRVKKSSLRLSEAKARVPAAGTVKLILKLKRRSDAIKIAKARKRGGKPVAAITVAFTDDVGNEAVRRAAIKLK